jgi:glycosyltransferase involved in cell wall biosynthesis
VTAPIRLAFVLPHLRPGGAERVVLNLLRALDRGAFAPHLFLARDEGAFLDLVPRDVVRIDLGGRRARQLPRRLAAALEAHRIDAAYSATAAINLALVASRLWGARGTRRIVSEHTTPASALAEAGHARLRRLLMRHLYPRADRVAVPTEAIGEELRQVLGRPRLRTVVLPNPVVEAIAEPHAPLPRPRPLMISAGRLVEAKGYDLLIDAAGLLAARGVEFDLHILARARSKAPCGSGSGIGPRRAYRPWRLLREPRRRARRRRSLRPRLAPRRLRQCHRRGHGGRPAGPRRRLQRPGVADRRRQQRLPGRAGSALALADAIEMLLADPARRCSVVQEGRRTAARFEVAAATRAFERVAATLVGR